MKDDSVPKADGIKQLRDGDIGGDTPMYTKSGDWPKRYRGYYIALKRKEEWALLLQKQPPLQHIMSWFYHNAMGKLIYSNNPFLALLKGDKDE